MLELTKANVATESGPVGTLARSYSVGYCDTTTLGQAWLIRYDGERAIWMLRLDTNGVLTMQKRDAGSSPRTFRAVAPKKDPEETSPTATDPLPARKVSILG